MKGDWTPRQRIEAVFRRELQRLVEQFLEIPDSATLGEINEALVQFQQLSNWLAEYGERAATKMVTAVSNANARSWREAAAKSTRGREIYRALQHEIAGNVEQRRVELIQENAHLIRSLPTRLREDTARFIAAMQMKGERPKTIARELQQQLPEVARSRLHLIARTETSKAATALTRARSEDLGLAYYIWKTSRDVRVRPSHRFMDQVIVPWDDTPAPEALIGIRSTLGHYDAGNCPNCRCDPTPLVDTRQIAWPARVYGNGEVRRMTLAQFKGLAIAA